MQNRALHLPLKCTAPPYSPRPTVFPAQYLDFSTCCLYASLRIFLDISFSFTSHTEDQQPTSEYSLPSTFTIYLRSLYIAIISVLATNLFHRIYCRILLRNLLPLGLFFSHTTGVMF